MIPSLPRTDLLRLSLSLALLLAAAITALPGCDSSDSIPLEDLPTEVERVGCTRAVACGGAENQTTCESTTFVAQNSGLLTRIEAVKRGTVKYDGDSARACLDAFTTDCANLVQPPACDDTFRGTVPAGGVCVIAAECADRGQCLKPDTCTVSCCAGTCEAVGAPVAIGGACAFGSSTPCVEGAFCDNDGTCKAQLPVGAECAGAADACAGPAVCLFLFDGSGTQTCTVISSEPGAACLPDANFGCGREDETCNATTSLCTKRSALGAACQASDDCVGYAYCDAAAGTCKRRPTVGQACDNAASVWCLGSLECANGVCVVPAAGVACVP